MRRAGAPLSTGSDSALERLPRRAEPLRMPRPLEGEEGLFVVDATWGRIAPMVLAPGVVTVGELEVIEHVRAGGACVDCRQPEYYAQGSLPGAVNVPHQLILDCTGSFDRERPSVLFCNGPQCTATPQAVARLLEAGHPAAALLYYRGGIHDWVTLGLPLEPP
jgi:rhodanese-related sulfurtransferase